MNRRETLGETTMTTMTFADRAAHNGFFGIALPTIRIAWPSLGTVAPRRPARDEKANKPCVKRDELEQLFRQELTGSVLSGRSRHAAHAAA
jgi:hypothetical protein